MVKALSIREATAADVAEIGRLVRETIRISNAHDYSQAVIEHLISAFSDRTVLGFLGDRKVLVACSGRKILGTASLEGDRVRTVFVLPESQRRGVGWQLMAAIERLAGEQGVSVLQVPASLTAKAFYANLGYSEVEEVLFGEERTVLMSKVLGDHGTG